MTPITKNYITIHVGAEVANHGETVIKQFDSIELAEADAERELEMNPGVTVYVARVELKLTTHRETIKERISPVNGGHS